MAIDGDRAGLLDNEEYMVRLSVAALIPDLLRELGVGPEPLLRRYGFNPDLFLSPDNPVIYCRIAQLIDACASQAACPTFGLRLGLRGTLASLGPLAAEMLKSSTVAAALTVATQHFSKQDRATTITLQEFEDEVELQHMIIDPRVTSGGQMADLAVGYILSVLRELCGVHWGPTHVAFVRRMPSDTSPYRSAISGALTFNSPFSAVRFSKRWLATPVSYCSNQLPNTRDNLREVSVKEAVLAQCVRLSLSSETCSVERVAHLLSMTSRTLHRRLAFEKTTFERLRQEARLSAAIRLMWDTDLTLTEIAILVGYSELSAFSRAFNALTGLAPSAYSRRARTASVFQTIMSAGDTVTRRVTPLQHVDQYSRDRRPALDQVQLEEPHLVGRRHVQANASARR